MTRSSSILFEVPSFSLRPQGSKPSPGIKYPSTPSSLGKPQQRDKQLTRNANYSTNRSASLGSNLKRSPLPSFAAFGSELSPSRRRIKVIWGTPRNAWPC
ncbi:unnamed protein product [Microthlaspi erraticum]|uniref:Uncharacterized protein n=1 Tax=Microthlaspi erraticum TaxID=1685480 RepID=A0A6D2JU17_9BRAS|nr:unnamed protein product [Microthlaspi erraticum]